jgi:hypothetical protein
LQWLLGAIAVAIFIQAASGAAFAEVTGAADNLRTGWYPDEPSLTHARLSGGGFQPVFKDSLHGQIYAQPLTANGTLLVVTEDNWAYGLDPLTGAVRWEKQFGVPVNAGEEPTATVKCTDLEPHVGITGTPVIDTEHNVAYFVSNQYLPGSSKETGWFMHAIELNNGNEVAHFPVKIEGEAQNLPPGVKFEAAQELQRPALLMMNGVVYAGFGSHCDTYPYEGWVMGVSSAGQVTTKWATSGNGDSIWQSGGGLVSDGPGQILFSTGNGDGVAGEWDPPPGLGNAPPEGKLGESVVRAEVQPAGGLKATDFFSPSNSKVLDEGDIDLGSSAPVALPSQYFGTPSVPDLLVQDGKGGYVYLLNRKSLGGTDQGSAKTDQVVQRLGPYGGVWGAATAWPGDGGYVYIPTVAPGLSGGGVESLLSFKYGLDNAGAPTLSLAGQSPENEFAFGSGSPIVTSQGATAGTAVLWITRCPPSQGCGEAKLIAYNPVPLSNKTLQVLWEAPIGTATKFSRPDANNGHIYVGNHEGQVFGYSGPTLTPSSESVELGSAVAGGQLTGKVTFTNTGTKLTVKAVHTPLAPFDATGLPAVGSVIEPGEVITVNINFKSSAPGLFKGSLGLVTEAGETQIALSGSATAPSPSTPPESGGTATLVTLVTPPGGPGHVATEPLPSLTKLKIRGAASRLGSHRRKVIITYTLSAASTVEVAIYRRVISHSCQRGASTCVRWVRTQIKLKVAGHAGTNVLAVNLRTLSRGDYRMDVTPITPSSASGVTQYVRFKAS